MNTYSRYCPNVFVAKCEQEYKHGDEILVETKYGKENECIVHNLVFQKDGYYYYSITRTDGFNSQEYAKKKEEKLLNAASNANKKSDAYYQASKEGADFLSLGEPIKVGHHSEKRHRNLIERNYNRMGKCVEYSNLADNYEERSKYWANRKEKIDLSMPESLEYFEFEVEKAQHKHQFLKDNPQARAHSYSLTYANNELKEARKKLEIAKKLWGIVTL